MSLRAKDMLALSAGDDHGAAGGHGSPVFNGSSPGSSRGSTGAVGLIRTEATPRFTSTNQLHPIFVFAMRAWRWHPLAPIASLFLETACSFVTGTDHACVIRITAVP